MNSILLHGAGPSKRIPNSSITTGSPKAVTSQHLSSPNFFPKRFVLVSDHCGQVSRRRMCPSLKRANCSHPQVAPSLSRFLRQGGDLSIVRLKSLPTMPPQLGLSLFL